MNFNIKIGKLNIAYGQLLYEFEPMSQYRHILYVDAIPFFVIRGNDLIAKKKCMRFKICEPIDPKCYKFLFDLVLSGNKNIGDMKISKIGPVGDVIEDVHYRGVKVKKWRINDEWLDKKITHASEVAQAIGLELKFNNYKVIRN